MKILAIESSCDETACAVIEDGVKILGSSIATSVTMHEKYGGIVPEVAAREQLKCVIPVIQEALSASHETIESIDSLAVTVGPGLIGSLLIGVETAKTIAFTTGKPIIPVNHVLAHMYANFLSSQKENSSRAQSRDNPTSPRLRGASKLTIEFPAISLVVSGGHTELFLMTDQKKLKWLGGTLDDAAGEAFDKTARLLGFGSRGGVAIQEAAGNKSTNDKSTGLQIKLPRPLMYDKTLNFSFSGLKTAILREVNKRKEKNLLTEKIIQEFAFEVQEAITDVLVAKTLHAVETYNAKSILVSGGVAANLRLREKFQSTINDQSSIINLHIPPVPLCTDNAAYIGAYAYFRGNPVDWEKITAIPDLSVEDVE
jgi:N6-L-threonylcarbamoyladenine synthase